MSKSKNKLARTKLVLALSSHYSLTSEQLEQLLLKHNIKLTYKNSEKIRTFEEMVNIISSTTSKKYRRKLRLSEVSEDKSSQLTSTVVRESVDEDFIHTVLDKITEEYFLLEKHLLEIKPLLEELDCKLSEVKPILDKLDTFSLVSVDFITFFDLAVQEFLHTEGLSKSQLHKLEQDFKERRNCKNVNRIVNKKEFKSLLKDVSSLINYFEEDKGIKEYNRDLQKLSIINKIKTVYNTQ